MVGYDLFSTVSEDLTCRLLWRPVVFLDGVRCQPFQASHFMCRHVDHQLSMSRLGLPYDSANSDHPGSTSDNLRHCCQRPWSARVEMTRVGLWAR